MSPCEALPGRTSETLRQQRLLLAHLPTVVQLNHVFDYFARIDIREMLYHQTKLCQIPSHHLPRISASRAPLRAQLRIFAQRPATDKVRWHLTFVSVELLWSVISAKPLQVGKSVVSAQPPEGPKASAKSDELYEPELLFHILLFCGG